MTASNIVRTNRPHRHSSPPRHRALAAARRVAGEITPEVIEQIAQRVAELLRADRAQTATTGRLLSANELASHLGVTRWWVYQHAADLGAIRIGAGPRARLRFDVEVAKAAFELDQRPREATPRARREPRTRQPVLAGGESLPLLPVTPRRVRGLLSRLEPMRRMGR